jgi:hypothetical protein
VTTYKGAQGICGMGHNYAFILCRRPEGEGGAGGRHVELPPPARAGALWALYQRLQVFLVLTGGSCSCSIRYLVLLLDLRRVTLTRAFVRAQDEPTNYLDRDSLGALADSIKVFEGGVVMISHNNGAHAGSGVVPGAEVQRST